MLRLPVRLKRAYDAPTPEDGKRYLVDRLWPRGVKRDDLRLDAWLKELAPSTNLRKWFGHDPDRWTEFRSRYKAELLSTERQSLLLHLAAEATSGTITLVFAARDVRHNEAVVLQQVLAAGGTPTTKALASDEDG
jgi:uncharacterized protein YeaO (DUF488 family)